MTSFYSRLHRRFGSSEASTLHTYIPRLRVLAPRLNVVRQDLIPPHPRQEFVWAPPLFLCAGGLWFFCAK